MNHPLLPLPELLRPEQVAKVLGCSEALHLRTGKARRAPLCRHGKSSTIRPL